MSSMLSKNREEKFFPASLCCMQQMKKLTARDTAISASIGSPPMLSAMRIFHCFIEAHKLDCLRDDGLSDARKLQDAGVFVDCERIQGSYHGVEAEFDTDFVQALLEKRAAFLRRYLQ